MRRAPAKFWDRIAPRYARKPVGDEQAYQRKLALTRNYLRPDMELLEFGCGTGSTAIAHAPHVKQIHATDISGKMLEIAKEKAIAAGVTNVSFERTTLEELAGGNVRYDAVLGLSILHLLDDRDDAIALVYRLLKPGGLFVSNTACLGDRMKYFKWIGPIGHFFGLIPRVRVFSAAELVASLEAAGFRIEEQWRPGKAVAVFIVAKRAD